MNKKLAVFFVMAYLFSWIVFVPLALNANGVIFLFPDDAVYRSDENKFNGHTS